MATKLRKINKRKTRELFAQNKPFIIVGDNVNEYHIISGWHCGLRIDPKHYVPSEWTFEDMVNNFQFYLERELGRRAAFYIEVGTNGD